MEMKNILRLEQGAMFLLSILAFNQLEYAWWWYLALILAPDLSGLGYLANPRVGSFTYNLAHHKAVAILVYVLGVSMGSTPWQLAGIILFGHSSLDRVFGYGLKKPGSFNETHLGRIGKEKG